MEALGTLILGLGNLVHADDGLGVHVIQKLQGDARVPHSVKLVDGGTQGLALIPHLSGYPRLLVIDAVDSGHPPGTVLRYEGTALHGLPGKPSVHQLGYADLMVAMQLLGEPPEEAVLIGVQPLSTEWSAELTPVVAKSVDKVIELVLDQIARWQADPLTARATLEV